MKYRILTGMACLAGCLTLGLMFSPTAWSHDEIPGAKQKTPIALVGGTVHPVSGPAIENGTVLFDKGKIVAVGTDVELPDETETIDVSGKHVYPAMFESHSEIGVTEIASVRETIDSSELGSFNPNVETRVAVNPDSEIIPVTRSNGVLLALSAPTGGVIAGKSCILQLDGWTFEDLTLDARTALHMRWPSMSPRFGFRRGGSAAAQARQRDQQLEEIETYFDEAEAYRVARQARPDLHPIDLKLEAMIPVLQGETPILISADDQDQIESAVIFCVERGLKPIIFGGFDAPLCAELLTKHDVPVVISAIYRTPRRADSDYDSSYTLPERLREAGIRFCISGSGRSETWNARNLPYHAATAVAFGLPHDEAIKAITLYPAQIFGVDDRVGSLEPGKDATLFIADGDPLETTTQVLDAFVQGRKVDMNDKHKRLYAKYAEKYRRIREQQEDGQAND